MFLLYHFCSWSIMNCGGNNQGGPFDLFYWINIILNQSVHQCFVKGVSGSKHNVQRDLVKGKNTRSRQSVKEIESSISFILLIFFVKAFTFRIGQEGLLELFGPGWSYLDDS